jgi:lipopolysaccharide transport system ATP-binding protein
MTDAAVPAPAIVRAAETTPGTAAAAPWAIRFTDIGKKYRLGATGRRQLNDNFRDALSAVFKGFVRAPLAPRAADPSEFWALRDINLEIARGDTVGIIGRNGAGKSTLLKILSRITAPTTGDIRYRGRLASLLEVGTGFHRELTGRENVYLNGSIIGMKRAEITRQFDAIVEFAALEKFIDTPVKFYSSGMYVRLAFAVAAHLRTDILVVDEVLAVGDAVFQKKCLGKMQDAATDGRTVLFVSHNMASVQGLCRLGALLSEGRLVSTGPSSDVIDEYLRLAMNDGASTAPGEFDLTARENVYTPGEIVIRRLRLRDADGACRDHFRMGEPIAVEIECTGLQRFPRANLGITIKSKEEIWIGSFNTGMAGFELGQGATSDTGWLRCTFDKLPLNPGSYSIALSIIRDQRNRADYVDRAATFHVIEGDVYGTGYPMQSKFGLIYLQGRWQLVEGEVDA